MEKTEIILNEQGKGEVLLFSDEKKAGLMDIQVTGDTLTVFHTEVDAAYEGRGFAKLLLEKLVSYAREKHLKIVPLCAFVHLQFRRHPDEYKDVWANH